MQENVIICNSAVFVKMCNFVDGGYEVFENKESYIEWAKDYNGFTKVLFANETPELQDSEIVVDKGFMRVTTKTGDSVSIPFTKVLIDGEQMGISKIFKKYWSKRND